MRSDLKKICLGSANFGKYYGYKNSKIKKKEISKIFKYARLKKINYVDTALNYPNSEKIIGRNGYNLNIITKIPKIPNSEKNPTIWIKKIILKSLKNLKTKKLYAVLFHHPPYTNSKKQLSLIIQYLEYLQKKKIIKKIGISVYNLHELKKSFSIYKFQIVQFQANVLDQRIINSKYLKILKKNKVEMHVRSIFLQGMLLSDVKNIPKKFKSLKNKLIFFDNWVKKKKITKLEACLRYLFFSSFIDKVVLGTNNYLQLKETIKTIEKIKQKIILPNQFKNFNSYLLNPKNW